MSSGNVYSSERLPAGEAIAAGLVVTISAGEWVVVDAPTTNPMGCAKRAYAENEICEAIVVIADGVGHEYVCGDAVAVGDDLVVTTGGKVVPYDAGDFTEGDAIYIVGRALTAGTADRTCSGTFNPRIFTVPTAPGE